MKKANRTFDYETYTEIFLTDRFGHEVAKTLIDREDKEQVCQYYWRLNHAGYAYTPNSYCLLHHLIIGRRPGWMTDHINRNRLDNRRGNLRHATAQENALNAAPSKKTGMRKRLSLYKVSFSLQPVPCLNFEELFIRVAEFLSPHMTAAEQSVYFKLLRLAYVSQSNIVFASYADILSACNLSLSSLQRILLTLRAKGLLTRKFHTHDKTEFHLYLPVTDSVKMTGHSQALVEEQAA